MFSIFKDENENLIMYCIPKKQNNKNTEFYRANDTHKSIAKNNIFERKFI